MNTVALENVSVRFGAVQALSSVSVSVSSGEVLMLVGPNGAGKSTLTRVLLGLIRPQAGVLKVDGKETIVNNSFKKSIGYLPEAVAFSENLSAYQVLRFFAWARGVSKKHAVATALERVGLTHAAKRRVRGYSKGMRQRLGLAAAILAEPELLILDEPTGGLDSEGLTVLWSVLSEWREKKRMVFMASHQLALLERRVDKMCVFKSGRVLAEDSPGALRISAGLQDRVRMRLSDAAKDEVQDLVKWVRAWQHGTAVREGDTLIIDLDQDALLELMNTQARFPKAVTGLRIEEPSLDMVYEHLLENA